MVTDTISIVACHFWEESVLSQAAAHFIISIAIAAKIAFS